MFYLLYKNLPALQEFEIFSFIKFLNTFMTFTEKSSPSKGLTVNAAVEPAAQPDRKEVQKTASPLPSFFRGPRALRWANSGKYTTEKVTSRSIVALVPLYSPAMPLVRISCSAMDVAEVAATAPPSAVPLTAVLAWNVKDY